jgi:hypothetical protein
MNFSTSGQANNVYGTIKTYGYESEKTSPLGETLAEMDCQLERLYKNIEVLNQRTAFFQARELARKEPTDERANVVDARSELVRKLSGYSNTVGAANAQLEEIIKRLDT